MGSLSTLIAEKRPEMNSSRSGERGTDSSIPLLINKNVSKEFLKEANFHIENEDEGEDDDNDSQNEALCELLGLSSFKLVTKIDRDDTNQNDPVLDAKNLLDDDKIILDEEAEAVPTAVLSSSNNNNDNNTAGSRIKLPRYVSRFSIQSQQCYAWMISNLFTPHECQELVGIAANSGGDIGNGSSSFDYVKYATHTSHDGTSYKVPIPKPNPHKLAVFHQPTWVNKIWKRIQPYITMPSSSSSSLSYLLSEYLQRDNLPIPIGINPRLRVLKYDATDGDEFQPHFDATTTMNVDDGDNNNMDCTSLLTVLLYLNDGNGIDFSGGETVFLSQSIGGAAKDCSEVDVDEKTSYTTTILQPTQGTVVIFEHDLYHCGQPLEWGTKFVLRTDIMFPIPTQELERKRQQYNWNDEQQHYRIKLEDTGISMTDRLAEAPPVTVEELTDQISTGSNAENGQKGSLISHEYIQLLQEGLSALDLLHDTTIESFCTPGRFALQCMLQDVIISSIKTDYDKKTYMVRLINMFLDAAFQVWKDSKK